MRIAILSILVALALTTNAQTFISTHQEIRGTNQFITHSPLVIEFLEGGIKLSGTINESIVLRSRKKKTFYGETSLGDKVVFSIKRRRIELQMRDKLYIIWLR